MTGKGDMPHDRWVWTTFNSYQWDLNYANLEVFRAMAEEMLFLANQGIEVLRLDTVAFIWKRLGTACENQPEAHTIIQAFNAMAAIVNLCAECYDLDVAEKAAGFGVYFLPVVDEAAPGMEALESLLDWMQQQVDWGNPMLVHCRYGIGRTGTIVLAFLL